MRGNPYVGVRIMNVNSIICKRCQIEKPFECFRPKKTGKYGKYNRCIECARIEEKKYHDSLSDECKQKILDRKKKRYHSLSPEQKRINLDNQKDYYIKHNEKILFKNARYRAKIENLEFNIELKDIIIPEICPILGILLVRNSNKIGDNSPTLDKIGPTKGYVKGNIGVISNKANKLKSDGTAEEHRKIANYMDSSKIDT